MYLIKKKESEFSGQVGGISIMQSEEKGTNNNYLALFELLVHID